VGLTPHDFRRSAARNLIKADVDRRIAMKITGHKTEHIFERYNIKTTDDVREALIKVGQFKTSSLARIG
jgi:integrase